MKTASSLARLSLLALAAAALLAVSVAPALGAPSQPSSSTCSKRAADTAAPSSERRAVRGCGKTGRRAASTGRTRDAAGPTVTWKAPIAGTTVQGLIAGGSCVVAASDTSGVDRVVFKLDGTILETERLAPWECDVNTTAVADGSHTLTAVAYDEAKNSRTVSTTIIVANKASAPAPAPTPAPAPSPTAPTTPPADTTAPTATWAVPTAGATIQGKIQGSACEVAASDASGIDQVIFKVDSKTLNTESDAPWNCIFDSTGVANGSHTLTATAYDRAGNTRSVTTSVSVANTVATSPAPDPTPTPSPEPPPIPGTSAGMLVGLDAGNYGSTGANEVKGAVNTVRYEAERGASGLAAYRNAGLKVQLNFAGPYNTGGVCALNATTWATNTLNFYKANTTPAVSPVIEALNEPGGSWFWGSGAASSANATCYRNLLKETHKAFHAQYGDSAPKILGTLDGSGGLAFGKAWLTSDWATYVDGFIVHPYGGTGTKSTSALGNHALIESARAMTGGPVYVTEIGWPTATGQSATGDSLQWSESEQAANITSFIAWCKGTGYVAEVIYFNYRDYGSNMWYGVLRSDGSRKPAYNALREAALKYGA